MNKFDDYSDSYEPVTASESFNRAVELIEREKYSQALFYIEDAIEKNYFGSDAYLVKAQILYELDKLDDSLEAIEIAYEREPYNKEIKLWQARIQSVMKNNDKAIQIIDEIIESDTSNYEAIFTKALIYYNEAMYDEALKLLFSILTSTAGNEILANASYWIAKIYQADELYKKAIKYMLQAIELDPFNEQAYTDAIEMLIEQKQYVDAEELLIQGIDFFPLSVSILIEYSNLLCKVNRLDEALDNYQKVLALDENNSQAYFNIGEIYLKKKKFTSAVRKFRKVLTFDDSDFEAKAKLADALFHLDETKQAFENIAEAVEKDDTNPELLRLYKNIGDKFVRLLEKQNEWAHALDAYLVLNKCCIDVFDSTESESNFEEIERLLKIHREIQLVPKSSETDEFHEQNIQFVAFDAAIHTQILISRFETDNQRYVSISEDLTRYLVHNSDDILKCIDHLHQQNSDLAFYGFYLLFLYYYKIDDIEEAAFEAIDKAIRCHNKYCSMLLRNKGLFLKSQKKYEQALIQFLTIHFNDCTDLSTIQEISKIYASMRNFEAALFYLSKYEETIKSSDAFFSYRDRALIYLQKAALWLALGDYEESGVYITQAKQIKVHLTKTELDRLMLLELIIAIETPEEHTKTQKLVEKVEQLEFQDGSIYPALICSLLIYRWEGILKIDKIQEPDNNLGCLVEIVKNADFAYQTQNKKKFTAVKKLVAKIIENFDVNNYPEYYLNLYHLSNDAKLASWSLIFLAPLVSTSVNAEDLIQGFEDYPELISFFRRLVVIRIQNLIKAGSKNYEKALFDLRLLNEIFPRYNYAKSLLIYLMILRNDNYDYLDLQNILAEQQNQMEVRNTCIDQKFEKAAYLAENLDLHDDSKIFELARINSLSSNWSKTRTKLKHLIKNKSTQYLNSMLIKDDFAFTIPFNEDIFQKFTKAIHKILAQNSQNNIETQKIDIQDIETETETESLESIGKNLLDLLEEISTELDEIIDDTNTNESVEKHVEDDKRTSKSEDEHDLFDDF